MTLATETEALRRWPAAADQRLALALMAAALIVALAQFPGPFNGNGDTAWLLIVAGRVLDGAVLYRDIFETNPPMSVLLYVPVVAVARLIGVAPEIAVYAAVAALALGAIAAAARLLPALGVGDRAAQRALLAVLAFALLIMPTRCFAQREHIAAIALVPYLLLLAARWSGPFRPGVGMVLLAGLGAGLALAIKPHFGAMLALAHLALLGQGLRAAGPGGGLALMRQALAQGRLVPPEALLALAIVAGYAAAVVAWFPDFLSVMLPRVALVYVPHTLTPLELLAQPATLTALAAAAMIALARPTRWSPLLLVGLAGAAGGFLSYAVQSKGWGYHQLPALTFACLAFAGAWLGPRRAGAPALSPALVGALVIFGGFAPWLFAVHTQPRALEAEIRRHVAEPSLLIASSNLGAAFPLVRRVEGRWVGRSASLWMSEGAQTLIASEADPARRAAIAALFALDRQLFVEDALAHTPDILAFAAADEASDLLAWALADPRMADLMGRYRQVAHRDGMRLFVRADRIAGGSADRAPPPGRILTENAICHP